MSRIRTSQYPLTVKARTPRDLYWRRQGWKSVIWGALPAVIVLGYFYPLLGYMVLLCMGASVGISFAKGRAWCDFCPRGTFFDMVMARWSRGLSVPKFLRSKPFRILMLVILMGVMTIQLAAAWGDAAKMGSVFWLLLTVTTVVGVVLAAAIHARAWCAFCPMGSMASWIGTRKQPLAIHADKCTQCGLCAKGCPMELYPGGFRDEGVMMHGDCLKCTKCIVQCPNNALRF